MPMQDHQERADARPVPDHAMPRHNRRKDTAMQDHANVRRKGRGSVVQGWQRQGTARAAQNAPTATRRGGPTAAVRPRGRRALEGRESSRGSPM